MSYEEPEYKVVKKTDVYEIRQYKKRTVAQIIYGEEDSGFECCLTTFWVPKKFQKLR